MKKKQHWTQTYDGRKKMAAIQRERWASKKQDMEEIDTALRTHSTNGISIRQKLAHAQTLEELNEIKSFLDLKDELMGRLP